VASEPEAVARIIAPFRRACGEAGFDLIQPLQVGWYNAQVTGSLRLEDFGSESTLALVVGNTRALWPVFLSALRAEPALLAAPHPLYAYTERCVARAAQTLEHPWRLRWSHAGGEQLVAMQRLAHAAGLAYLSQSQLSVHPEYGPWIGLRAALSIAVPGPPGPAPELAHPCGGCAGRCLPAFERALAALQGEVHQQGVERSWQLWLACRDACPTGQQYRYDEAQILYHYLKDRNQLREACRARPGPA
jgi:methylmalonic aciduria homocystinuria type C protein